MTRLSPLLLALLPALAQAQDIDHGHYLVTVMGCTDCHTPGHFLGRPTWPPRCPGWAMPP
ncbi:MAG: hypothetical protein ACK4GM_16340 [Tabrizicola sp.]